MFKHLYDTCLCYQRLIKLFIQKHRLNALVFVCLQMRKSPHILVCLCLQVISASLKIYLWGFIKFTPRYIRNDKNHYRNRAALLCMCCSGFYSLHVWWYCRFIIVGKHHVPTSILFPIKNVTFVSFCILPLIGFLLENQETFALVSYLKLFISLVDMENNWSPIFAL